ncbi:hypothetical protein G3480_08405 [Thiorhodococcus mannitoliphagus]|uniref:Uncharacterized protein n=1 Tax=Thiorhodococcus mannitoliphagus TaxID=329406 RepID=A0A6P1DPX6_9GAMM|nr:hypothetical protein [Thiorhodococcus mannitoliphagus]NEX20327.1 hypothetical protein [Thiorhodococcus mannitoliphagus]
MLVKFAAKRTWPEKASSWEHEGDADSVEAFAAEFAAIEQLPVDTELVVMTKDDGGPSPRFMKIVGTSPYAFESAEPKTQAASPEPSAPAAPDDAGQEEDPPVGMPNLSPVISMLFYMGKVSVIATLAIAVMAVFITYLKNWLA